MKTKCDDKSLSTMKHPHNYRNREKLSLARICELAFNMTPTLFTILLFTVTIFGFDDPLPTTTTLEDFVTSFDTSTADDGLTTTLPVENQADEMISPTDILNEDQSYAANHIETWDKNDVETMQLSIQNCNREITLTENSRQIVFTFTPDAAKTRGQCQITIRGPSDRVLVLVFSNVRLSKKRQDSLKIVTRKSDVSFTMKEFNENEQFSALLPNVSTAYLIYSYNVINIVENTPACFFLNAFSIFLN